MSPTIALLRKELVIYRNDRAALFLSFVVPVVMIFLFGKIFGVDNGGSGPREIPVLCLDQANTAVSRAIIKALDDEPVFKMETCLTADDGRELPLTPSSLRARLREGKRRYGIVLANDDTGLATIRIRWLYDPRDEMEAQLLEGMMQKTVFTKLPGLLMAGLQGMAREQLGTDANDRFTEEMSGVVQKYFDVDPAQIKALMENPVAAFDQPGPEATSAAGANGSGQSADFMQRLMPMEREQVVGVTVKSPWITRSVGGWAVMFLLFGVSGAAISLLEDKKAGLYPRLLSAPLNTSHILFSKYLFFILQGLVQLAFLFCAGWILFGLDPLSNLPLLLLMCLATAAASTGFGMLLASLVKTPSQANGISTMLILVFSMLGGAMFPVSFMPGFIQKIAIISPVYWAMEGFLDVLWAGRGLRDVLPELAVLAGFASLTIAISHRNFRRGSLFS